MFSTTIMGRTTVCVSNPETIKFVLSTAHSSFPEGFGMQHVRLTSQGVFRGPGHPHFRRIILQDTTGESLQKILPFISSTAKKVVDEWENKESVHVSSEMNKVVKYLLQFFSHLFSYLFESYSDVESQVVWCSLVVCPSFPNFQRVVYYAIITTKLYLMATLQTKTMLKKNR